ncbi:hypothetical protein CR513_42107, partial [Mucuna pruriens]
MGSSFGMESWDLYLSGSEIPNSRFSPRSRVVSKSYHPKENDLRGLSLEEYLPSSKGIHCSYRSSIGPVVHTDHPKALFIPIDFINASLSLPSTKIVVQASKRSLEWEKAREYTRERVTKSLVAILSEWRVKKTLWRNLVKRWRVCHLKTKLMVKQIRRLKAKLGERLEWMKNEIIEGLDSEDGITLKDLESVKCEFPPYLGENKPNGT